MNYLFVYGTLLSPIRHIVQMLFPKVGTFQSGYVMGNLYNVGNYPALVLDHGGGKVFGEIYSLPENFSFRELDAYEDYYPGDHESSEFLRLRTNIILKDQSTREAWVYVYNHSNKQLEKITSGNYLEYIQSVNPA